MCLYNIEHSLVHHIKSFKTDPKALNINHKLLIGTQRVATLLQ